MEQVAAPIEAEPAHVGHDGVDEFLFFLGRVGVVEAQIAHTAEFLGDAEIQADRLGMADVQIAVGFRRKPRDHALGPPRRQIVADDVTDEIAGAVRVRFGGSFAVNGRGGRGVGHGWKCSGSEKWAAPCSAKKTPPRQGV